MVLIYTCTEYNSYYTVYILEHELFYYVEEMDNVVNSFYLMFFFLTAEFLYNQNRKYQRFSTE